MKKFLNTLYITTQGAYLNHEGESVLVNVEHEVRLRVPIHLLESIICFGRVSMSPPLMGLCGQRGVHISFLSENNHFLARVQGSISGNVLLRRQHYRIADNPQRTAMIARACLAGKIANSRVTLQRALRDHPEIPGSPEIERAITRLSGILHELENTESVDALRGKEGEAAKRYFDVFDHLILQQKSDFYFQDRNRRPPTDNVNAILSFLYTLLTHDAESALESVGLDPQVGFLHTERPGRPSLALDLIEEFRSFIADRLTLSLINLKQLQPNDFKQSESGAITLADDARRTVLAAYQKRKQELIVHPFLNESVEIGLLPYIQALLLARHLRGDLDNYPPFIWK